MILFSLNKYKQNCVVYIWYYSLGISTGSRTDRSIFLSPRRVSPFLAWVIFTRARVSLALLSLRKNGDYSQSSTGSTVGRLCWFQRLQQLFKWLDNDIQQSFFLILVYGHELPPCRFDYDRAGQYKISQNFIISIGDQLNDSINEKVQIRSH